MGWKEFFASIIGDAAWPLVFLIVAVMFRRQLAALLSKVTGWEGLGQKVTFGDELKQAEDLATHVTLSPDANRELGPVESPPASSGDRSFALLVREAEENPSYVILESWERIVGTLRQMLGKDASNDDGGLRRAASQHDLIQAFERQPAPVTKSQHDTLKRLQKLRDDVAHGKAKPTPGEAVAYADLAHDLSQWFMETIGESDSRPVWDPRPRPQGR